MFGNLLSDDQEFSPYLPEMSIGNTPTPLADTLDAIASLSEYRLGENEFPTTGNLVTTFSQAFSSFAGNLFLDDTGGYVRPSDKTRRIDLLADGDHKTKVTFNRVVESAYLAFAQPAQELKALERTRDSNLEGGGTAIARAMVNGKGVIPATSTVTPPLLSAIKMMAFIYSKALSDEQAYAGDNSKVIPGNLQSFALPYAQDVICTDNDPVNFAFAHIRAQDYFSYMSRGSAMFNFQAEFDAARASGAYKFIPVFRELNLSDDDLAAWGLSFTSIRRTPTRGTPADSEYMFLPASAMRYGIGANSRYSYDGTDDKFLFIFVDMDNAYQSQNIENPVVDLNNVDPESLLTETTYFYGMDLYWMALFHCSHLLHWHTTTSTTVEEDRVLNSYPIVVSHTNGVTAGPAATKVSYLEGDHIIWGLTTQPYLNRPMLNEFVRDVRTYVNYSAGKQCRTASRLGRSKLWSIVGSDPALRRSITNYFPKSALVRPLPGKRISTLSDDYSGKTYVIALPMTDPSVFSPSVFDTKVKTKAMTMPDGSRRYAPVDTDRNLQVWLLPWYSVNIYDEDGTQLQTNRGVYGNITVPSLKSSGDILPRRSILTSRLSYPATDGGVLKFRPLGQDFELAETEADFDDLY